MSQISDLGREEIQQQWNMYQAQDELTYKYFNEMKEYRKQDKEAWKKWNEEKEKKWKRWNDKCRENKKNKNEDRKN